jgi:hypothetical protein
MEGIGPVEPLGIFSSNWFKFNGKNASQVMARGLEEKKQNHPQNKRKSREQQRERPLAQKRHPSSTLI